MGAVIADKFRGYGITTVAEVAELSESTLASLVGGTTGSARQIQDRRAAGRPRGRRHIDE